MLLLTVAVPSAGVAAEPLKNPAVVSDAVATDVARSLCDGRFDAARARFDETLARRLPGADLERLFDVRRRERAPLTSLRVRDRRSELQALTITAQCTWTRGAATDVQLTVRPGGAVTQLQVWDEDDPAYEYRTRNSLRPPFRGTWTVANAARDIENHYYSNPNLRFALDWVIRDGRGKTFRNKGERNEDYYAFGQAALSAASGTVVLAVDGVPDNQVPGKGDPYSAAGNYVVINIGSGEYAMFMHLMRGSVQVRVGEHVRAGQPIARVGNSGRCTEPNLQFQIADKPTLIDAHSLPVQFSRALLDGEQAERVRPVYGSVIAPAEHWDPNGPMHEDDDD